MKRERGNGVQKYVVHRPDEAAMRRVLEKNTYTAAGTVIRLAWLEGLLRDEITRLTWDDVAFFDMQIRLKGRSVPLCGEMRDFLLALSERRESGSPLVVLSDRDGTPPAPQSVSRLVRAALDAEGLNGIRLLDLRHDFIIRRLAEDDWQRVSQMSGVDAATLNAHFARYISGGKISTRAGKKKSARIDEFRLLRFLQKESGTVSSAILLLSWQAGLSQEEISSWTWKQVDLSRRVIHLNDRDVPLPQSVCGALAALGGSEGEVILAPVAGRALTPNRISKTARSALVRAGMDDVTLRDLRMDFSLRTGAETQVLNRVRDRGFITRNEIMSMFGISRASAYTRLRHMEERGRLVKIGTKYYHPETVVAPEEQRGAILGYLEKEGPAYRKDIASLLRIPPEQCYPILKRLVASGDIVCERQKYYKRGA